jgi:hypothetical protein
VVRPAVAPDLSFVNTVPGSSPSSLQEGVILTSPESFQTAVSKPLPMPVLKSGVHLRKSKQLPTSLPRRSSSLTKKAVRLTAALAVA